MASNPQDVPAGGTSGDNSEKAQLRKHSDNDLSRAEIEHSSSKDKISNDDEYRRRLEASAKLENPLAGLTPEQLSHMGEEFCAKHGITEEEDIRAFRLGAMISGNMNQFTSIDELTDRERNVLDREITHKWSNPMMLYAVVVVCSLCAAVQGKSAYII